MIVLPVGVTGRARVGKSTLAKALCDHVAHNNTHDGPYMLGVVESFAGELKRQCAEATGLPLSWFDDETHKEHLRPLMQWWGTEFRRNSALDGYGDYWVDAMRQLLDELHDKFKSLMVKHSLVLEGQPRVLVVAIPDVRFDNEARMILDDGGIVINLEALNAKTTEHSAHASERGVSRQLISATYHNDHALGTSELVRIAQEIYDTHICPAVE